MVIQYICLCLHFMFLGFNIFVFTPGFIGFLESSFIAIEL